MERHEETKKILKIKLKNLGNESFLAKGQKYYYMKENGNELIFRKKSNSNGNYFYFKCPIDKYHGMILRNDKKK